MQLQIAQQSLNPLLASGSPSRLPIPTEQIPLFVLIPRAPLSQTFGRLRRSITSAQMHGPAFPPMEAQLSTMLRLFRKRVARGRAPLVILNIIGRLTRGLSWSQLRTAINSTLQQISTLDIRC